MALKIKRIKDYIVELEGKSTVIINEVVKFSNGVQGIVMRADETKVFVALLENSLSNPLVIGDVATPTGKDYTIKISNDFLGNIVSVQGELFTSYKPVLSKNLNSADKAAVERSIFRIARPIYGREFVNQQLHTGLTAIDWAIPIGLGQRELILGDRKTGKTAIAMNTIVAQQNTDLICVYVAIGQKKTSTLDFYEKLGKYNMKDRTIVVTASADQYATKKWLAPYVGMSIAEYYQERYGRDVLIIFDDLSKHADAYRELSLLLESAPAREAYPGDIFYLHSRLLERAGRFTSDFGGGSITALPIIQTEAGDITSYIPTNVISITDGQIFTSKSLFNEGQRPAIDVPYSVSRVGSAAQPPALRSVSSGLKYLVSSYTEAKKLARLSGQTLDDNKDVVDRGRVFMSLLVQPENDLVDTQTGVLALTLFRGNYLNFFKTSEEVTFIKTLLSLFLNQDYIGKQVSETLMRAVGQNKVMVEMTLREIVLPFVKYHLLDKYPYLSKDQAFISVYGQIRDDGRVYNAFKSQVKEAM